MPIRTYTNPRMMDISRGLQEVLYKNGMQAHISVNNDGTYNLIVLGHDSPVIKYSISAYQVELLMNWGNNYANKTAYETFTGIIKNDFDMPDNFVSARNVGGRVISGLHGYRIGNGEYGYSHGYMNRPIPFFSPFHRHMRGWCGDFLGWTPRMQPGFHGRRIDGRYFRQDGPFVPERPDGRMKPGELRSGGYGFYYKGNQQTTHQDVLDELNVEEAILQPLKSAPRNNGQAIPYKEHITSDVYFTADKFNEVLKSHGIIVDAQNKKLTIQSSETRVDLTYDLTQEELNKILARDIRGNDAVSVAERLNVINDVIAQDYQSGVTMDMLNSKNLVNMELKPEVKQEVEAKFIEREQQIAAQQARIAEKNAFNQATADERGRLMGESLRIAEDIHAINGREIHEIMGNYGFFMPVRNGREMVIGEIRVSETAGGHHLMTAEINGFNVTHSISKEQYDKFIALDDENRLRLFDDIYKEVKIKSDDGGRDFHDPVVLNVKDENGNYITREQAEIYHSTSDFVDGSVLSQIKDNKGFYREIENGREVQVGDISVEKVAEDKYRMTAVIDGVPVTHDIRQKDYDKFLAVDDLSRLKLFAKIFPEVDIKTHPGMERNVNVGAAILAALVVGTEVVGEVAGMAHAMDNHHHHHHDEGYREGGPTVYAKHGVVSPGEVAQHMFNEQMEMAYGNPEDRGVGRGI